MADPDAIDILNEKVSTLSDQVSALAAQFAALPGPPDLSAYASASNLNSLGSTVSSMGSAVADLRGQVASLAAEMAQAKDAPQAETVANGGGLDAHHLKWLDNVLHKWFANDAPGPNDVEA